jgi:hypothetical protein
MKYAIGLGAQTSRPDDAGPVRTLLGRTASPAAVLVFASRQRNDAVLVPAVIQSA